jgi:hypothetical protein
LRSASRLADRGAAEAVLGRELLLAQARTGGEVAGDDPGLDRLCEVVLEVDGLVKHFGDVRAVDGVSLTLAPGEVLGHGLPGPLLVAEPAHVGR